jgi:hypothetical protein
MEGINPVPTAETLEALTSMWITEVSKARLKIGDMHAPDLS